MAKDEPLSVTVNSDSSSEEAQQATQSAATTRPSISGFRGHLRNARRYFWDDPDKPEDEKWLLFKLDVFLLTCSCLGYFSKNLDQANLDNAYVSGMKERLGMHGSQLTYSKNCFTAGYVVGQIPAVILVTRARPSLLIPFVEVCWSILTFCTAAATKVSHLYAIRFLVGVCESSYFPVMIYLIGSWYRKHERGKRVTIFYCTATLAGMFSGYLQAGAYKGLNGVLGHEGWQWLFIVCGIISLPIGVISFFFIPDFPETTRAFYLTESERILARKRLTDEGLKPLGASKWDKTKVFRIFSQWQAWVLPLGYFFVQGSFPAYQPVFALWLKSTGHTIYQINVWPTGQTAVGVVVQVLAAMLSDSPLLRGRRWQAITVMQAGTFFSVVVLAIWTVPDKLKFVAYYFMYFCAGTPGIWYAWYTELIPHDHEMRGFVIAASNMFSYIQSIWFTIAVWRTAESPRFRPGFIFAATLGVALVLLMQVIRVLQARDTRKRKIAQEFEQEDAELDVTTAIGIESKPI